MRSPVGKWSDMFPRTRVGTLWDLIASLSLPAFEAYKPDSISDTMAKHTEPRPYRYHRAIDSQHLQVPRSLQLLEMSPFVCGVVCRIVCPRVRQSMQLNLLVRLANSDLAKFIPISTDAADAMI